MHHHESCESEGKCGLEGKESMHSHMRPEIQKFHGPCPACGGDCGGCPVECASIMWKKSFFQAMRELQVETLKSKMQQKWKDKTGKAADVVLEAMSAKWQAMKEKMKVKEEIKEKFKDLWAEE